MSADYESIKTRLQSQNKLWEDEDFPPNWSSLASGERHNSSVMWLRPPVSSQNFSYGSINVDTEK